MTPCCKRFVSLALLPFFLGFSSASLSATSHTEDVQPLEQQGMAQSDFQRAITHIRNYYVGDISDEEIYHAALRGVMEKLDPYSDYLDEKKVKALMNLTRGEYKGLGIEVEQQGEDLVVVTPIALSPAQQAGILAGDKILEINHEGVNGKSLEQVSQMMRSTQSGAVHLKIMRNTQLLDFAVTRKSVTLHSVFGHLSEDGIAYMHLTSFRSQTRNEIIDLLSGFTDNFSHLLKGIIFDLRDNPGGILSSALEIADLFLEQGIIISTRGRYEHANVDFFASPNVINSSTPIVILINDGTASAAEILAAAFKDNNRALLLGERSFGKGSIQSLFPFGEGDRALKLTTAHYYSPDGDAIHEIGILPHISTIDEIAANPHDSPIMLKAANNQINAELTKQIDTTMKRAYGLLRQPSHH